MAQVNPEEASQRPVTSIKTADQLSLLRYCLAAKSACSPSIVYINRDVFQRPFAALVP